jgi:hypothetical protein
MRRRPRGQGMAVPQRETKARRPTAPRGNSRAGAERPENGSWETEGTDRTNRYTALLGPVCREPRIGYAGVSAIAPKVACGVEVRRTTGPLAREGGTSHDGAR